MNRRAKKSLRDALNASDELIDRFGQATLEQYLDDRDLQLITERLVIAVGECVAQATRSDPALLDAIPEAWMLSELGIGLPMAMTTSAMK